MSEEDYRRFLYISVFKKNKFTLPFLVLISLIGSVLITLSDGIISMMRFIIGWILLFVIAIIVTVFKIERKKAQRIKTDKTGTFHGINTLKFYDDRIVMENKSLKSTGELRYDQFFTVAESKDYFIFYLTAHQASLIRKKDVGNLKEFKEFIVKKFGGRYKRL
ncbi:MAG: YcxB family protein [Clostridiaceae bacterium]|nr:YcxB family protein [Clostridiaceae bacterium]